MKTGGKKVIIWDWNGTLLNDLSLCVDCMNQVLDKRHLPALNVETYRNIFTFPVREYYQRAGFDFQEEDFHIPAMEFIDLYYKNIYQASLFPKVHHLLQQSLDRGLYQVVLSAMEHAALETSLTDKGIRHYFDEVVGIDDHYGRSKLDNGKQLLQRLKHPKEEVLLIGDTLHDLEVARALGVDCALVSSGHQSRERLLAATEHVFDHLDEVFGNGLSEY